MSQALSGAVGCGNVQRGSWEGASAFNSRAEVSTRQLAGDKGDWRVMERAPILPPNIREAGKGFRQERDLCSRKIL